MASRARSKRGRQGQGGSDTGTEAATTGGASTAASASSSSSSSFSSSDRCPAAPSSGCCLFDALDPELQSSVALFLSGAPHLLNLAATSRANRGFTSQEWLWRQCIEQEFGDTDGLPLPGPHSSSASAFPHRQLRLVYPVAEIAAHNLAAAADANARAVSSPTEAEEPEILIDGWGGLHRRPRETPAPGSDVPCELVRVERRPWKAEDLATQQDEGTSEVEESKHAELQPDRISMSDESSPTAAAAAVPTTASPLPAASPLVATYANLYAVTRLRQVRWFAHPNLLEVANARPRTPAEDASGAGTGSSPSLPVPHARPRVTRAMFESEGQALVAVGARSEWLLSIAGFGRHGPSVEIFVRRRATDEEEQEAGNKVSGCWLACSSTPDPTRVLLDGAPADRPIEGVYGLVAQALDARHVLVVSGYRSGGYSRLTRRCFLLKLMGEEEEQAAWKQDAANAAASSSAAAGASSVAPSSTPAAVSPSSPRPLLHLRWIPLPLSARLLPQPHCYGSLVIHHNPRSGLPPRVLAFGGTNDSGASNALSILDLSSMTWSASLASTTGESPPAMHSHTAVVIGDAMWVCGGASGSDPPRSGRDHQEVFRLDLLSMTWSRMTARISGARPTLDRRHRGHAVGSKIVFVGIDAATQKNKARSAAAASVAAKAGTAATSASSSSAASIAAAASAAPRASVAVVSPSGSASKRARADDSGTAAAAAAPAPSTSAVVLDADDEEEEAEDEDEDEAPVLEDEDEEADDFDPSLVRRRSPSSRGVSYVAGVVVLDTERLQWVWPVVQSPEHGPRFPRYASSSCVAGDEILLFAGCMSSGRTQNDLYSLALNASLLSAPQHASRFRAKIEAEAAMDAARVVPESHGDDDDEYVDSEAELEEDDPVPMFLQQQRDLLGALRHFMLAGSTAGRGNGFLERARGGDGGAGAEGARETDIGDFILRGLRQQMDARATGRDQAAGGMDQDDEVDEAEANEDDEEDEDDAGLAPEEQQ